MKVLLTGATGVVGRAIRRATPSHVELTAPPHSELDIVDETSVSRWMRDHQPEVVINAAAYLAADKAEQEPERAHAVNATGPMHLARAARECGCRMIQLSTAYVFDGNRRIPYRPDDLPDPLSVYGRTKWAGEKICLDILAERCVVLRSSWIYAPDAPSILATLLRRMQTQDEIEAAIDQIGSPTAASEIASVVWWLAERSSIHGVQHWSDAGEASWYDFALATAEHAREYALLERAVKVKPTLLGDRQNAAHRPRFSVLDSTQLASHGLHQTPWRERLRQVIAELARD